MTDKLDDIMRDIGDVQRVNIADGDILVVSMPEVSSVIPREETNRYMKDIARKWRIVFKYAGVDARAVVVPRGMKFSVLTQNDIDGIK